MWCNGNTWDFGSHILGSNPNTSTNGGIEQLVARQFHKLKVVSSNLTPVTIKATLAQLVERRLCKAMVVGSIPIGGSWE